MLARPLAEIAQPSHSSSSPVCLAAAAGGGDRVHVRHGPGSRSHEQRLRRAPDRPGRKAARLRASTRAGDPGLERRLRVRLYPAVRRPAAAPRAVPRARASPCSACPATSSAARSRAPPRRSPSSARDLRGDVPADREDRRQRRRPAPALRAADRGRRRRRRGRRRPVELREVPRLAGDGAVVARFRSETEPDDPSSWRRSRPSSPTRRPAPGRRSRCRLRSRRRPAP